MGSPIRVLHAVVNMNRGGAETFLMNLYRNTDRTKIQFDFLTCKPGVYDQEIIELGGKVHRIPYISDIGHFRYVKALEQFFQENNKYSIVHSHMDKMSGLVLRAAKKADIPIRISHSHSTRSEGSMLVKSYKWYAGKLIENCATNLLACSKESAQWLFPTKIDKTQVIKNGIDFNRFLFSSNTRTEVRSELNVAENDYVIGHVGRFSEPKNHSFIIDLFARTLIDRPNSVLILVGDGPLINKMKEKVLRLNLESKVKFLGSRNDVHRLLQSFDLLLFPSLYEGLPLTLIEAQCAGLPCLVSSVITDEVDLGMDLIKFIPLSSIEKWLEQINKYGTEKLQRPYAGDCISQKGYDIKDTSEKLEKLYFSLKR